METNPREAREKKESQRSLNKIRQRIVEAVLSGRKIIIHCPLRDCEKAWGKCGKPGNKIVEVKGSPLVIPCEYHYEIYIENSWEVYDI